MASVTLTAGTKEYLIVDLADSTGVINDLTTATARYDIKDQGGALKVTAGTVAFDGTHALKFYCLADTTTGGGWAAGAYRLYVYFTVGSEIPRIGPLTFSVDGS